MFTIYTNVRYGKGIRLMNGHQLEKCETYEEAIKKALEWLKQNPGKILIDVCIISDCPPEKLIEGERYDLYKGIMAYDGEDLHFGHIEIKDSPYRITGIYEGCGERETVYANDDSLNDYCEKWSGDGDTGVTISDRSGFNKLIGMEIGESWKGSPLDDSSSTHDVIAPFFQDWKYNRYGSGRKVYEFDNENDAKRRLYEMVLAGWNSSNAAYVGNSMKRGG